MDKQGKPVKVINSVPALVTDGHGLGVDPENGNASLVFIQIVNQNQKDAKELESNVVANVRLSRDQLKKLNDDITKAISNFEEKEKKKVTKDTPKK